MVGGGRRGRRGPWGWGVRRVDGGGREKAE